jgi:hypothetical protein
MALSTATLQTQLDTILTALATGETSVRAPDGRMVTYSIEGMERQRDWLQRQLNASSGMNVRLGRYNPDYDREVSGG